MELSIQNISESKIKLSNIENKRMIDERIIPPNIEQFKTKIDEIQSSFDLFKSQSEVLRKSENGKLKTEVEKVKNQLEILL